MTKINNIDVTKIKQRSAMTLIIMIAVAVVYLLYAAIKLAII